VAGRIRIQVSCFEKMSLPAIFHFEINKCFQLFAAKIPYATEQGIFRGVSGKIFHGTGNLGISICTRDASILNFEQPQVNGAPESQASSRR
jgi:hypothetical protein